MLVVVIPLLPSEMAVAVLVPIDNVPAAAVSTVDVSTEPLNVLLPANVWLPVETRPGYVASAVCR